MKTLLKKLHAIQTEIESVEKTGYNDFQKYKYVKEADVLDAVRPLLVKHNVILLTSTKAITNIGDMTQVELLFTWFCADTGEELQTTFFAQGVDKADKGVYKAYTGGLKYFLMKQFLISSEDDPENEKEQKIEFPKQAYVPTQKQDSMTAEVCPSGKNRGIAIDMISTPDLENDLKYWNARAAKGEVISGKLSIYLRAVEKELSRRKQSNFSHLDNVPPMEDLPF